MNYLRLLLKRLLFSMLICAGTLAHAQDTTHITLQKAEKQFLEKNLQLLAEKYNVAIARAAVVQARLYNNPALQLSSALYNQDQKKILDVSNRTGQYGIGIQQLIILAVQAGLFRLKGKICIFQCKPV